MKIENVGDSFDEVSMTPIETTAEGGTETVRSAVMQEAI